MRILEEMRHARHKIEQKRAKAIAWKSAIRARLRMKHGIPKGKSAYSTIKLDEEGAMVNEAAPNLGGAAMGSRDAPPNFGAAPRAPPGWIQLI